MESKSKLNVKYIDIDTTLLKNTENLLNPAWISNYGRQFPERAIVFFYLPKSHGKYII